MLAELSAMLDPENAQLLAQDTALISKKDEYLLGACLNIMLSGCLSFDDMVAIISRAHQPLCFFSLISNQSIRSHYVSAICCKHPLIIFYRWCLIYEDIELNSESGPLLTQDRRAFAQKWLTQLVTTEELALGHETVRDISSDLSKYRESLLAKVETKKMSRHQEIMNRFVDFVFKHSYLSSDKLIADFFDQSTWNDLCESPQAYRYIIERLTNHTNANIAEIVVVFKILCGVETASSKGKSLRFWVTGVFNDNAPYTADKLLSANLILLRACISSGEAAKAYEIFQKCFNDFQKLPKTCYALELALSDRDRKILSSDTELCNMFVSSLSMININELDHVSWKFIILVCLENDIIAKWSYKFFEKCIGAKKYLTVYEYARMIWKERKPASFLHNLCSIPMPHLNDALDLYFYRRDNDDFVNNILQECCNQFSKSTESGRMTVLEHLAEAFIGRVKWDPIPYHLLEFTYLVKDREGGTKQNLRCLLVKLLNSPARDQHLVVKVIEIADMLGQYLHSATLSAILMRPSVALSYLRKCENWSNCSAAMLSLWNNGMLELCPFKVTVDNTERDNEAKIKLYYLEYLLQISEEI